MYLGDRLSCQLDNIMEDGEKITGMGREIEQHRAYRAPKEDKISDNIIRSIIIAATYAPPCFNSQSQCLGIRGKEPNQTFL